MKPRMLLLATALGWSAAVLPAQTAPLTTLRAIHAVTNAEASRHLPVEFEATVTYFRGYEKTLFVQDGDAAIYVQATTALSLAPGDRIRVRGAMQESFRPFVMSSSIERLEHGALPVPVHATFDDLIHARYDCRLVTVRAVVRSADVLNFSAHNSSLQLAAEGGNIDVTVNTDDATTLNSMLDAEVEVTGPVSGRFDGKMQQTGVLIHLPSLADIKVLKRPDADPWSLAATPMDEVLNQYHVNNLTRRARVQGTITYYQPGSAVVLQNGARSLWIVTQGRSDLTVGDVADATGIPDVHDGFLTLTRAEVRDSGKRAPIAPLLSTWRELTQSHHIFDLVSIQAKVVMEAREAAQDEYVLLADGELFSAILRHPVATYSAVAPAVLPPMKQIPVGSTVQVSGICLPDDSNPFDALVPFDLVMRSFDDIVVVAKPSWLTVGNLVMLVSVLLVMMLAVTAWGWTLRGKVGRQTEILAAQAAREAEKERRNAQLQQQRSRILEDINGSRPLVEVLEEIAEFLSIQLNGAACWCEITDGARLGRYAGQAENPRVVREPLPARSGPALGMLCAAIDPGASLSADEKEVFRLASRLATLAIETRRMYSDLVHRSEFDLLTDIHNRFSLDKHMEFLIARAREEARIFGLIYVDLDEFKQVNDLYGHHVGDLYLQEVSTRMKRQLRAGDLLARLGGDEFAALVPEVRNRAAVEEIALRLESCFSGPIAVEGYVLQGSASVGFALYPEDATTSDGLLSAADAAMYVAKNMKRQRRKIPDASYAAPFSVKR